MKNEKEVISDKLKRILKLSRAKYENVDFINLSLKLNTEIGPINLETNISNQRWCKGIGVIYREIHRLLKDGKIPHHVVHDVLYDLDKFNNVDVDSKGNLYLMNLERSILELDMFDSLSQYNGLEYIRLKEVFKNNVVLANKDNADDIYFEIPIIPKPFINDIDYLRNIDLTAAQYIGDRNFEIIL